MEENYYNYSAHIKVPLKVEIIAAPAFLRLIEYSARRRSEKGKVLFDDWLQLQLMRDAWGRGGWLEPGPGSQVSCDQVGKKEEEDLIMQATRRSLGGGNLLL